jgi:hypothetical protein
MFSHDSHKSFRAGRGNFRRISLLVGIASAAIFVAVIGCVASIPSSYVNAPGTFDENFILLQQSLDGDDSVADSILESARRKYAAMKRLATKQVMGASAPMHPKGHASSSVSTATQDAKDKKVIEAMLKGGGGADHKTLMSRLETAIANHKLSTRGLVEAVHEAQKVVLLTD